MSREKAPLVDHMGVSITMGGGIDDTVSIVGHYIVECYDKDGNLKWEEDFDNVVCTIGKNVALDAFLAGSAYTVVGPFMGLISSTSFSAVAAADTMASHSGWLEAGNANTPTYSGTRKTAAWSAASGGSKSLSSALSFTMTGSGTIQGAFMTYFTGAVNTIDSTAGTLLSAGSFTGGSRTVASTDVVNVSYSLSM